MNRISRIFTILCCAFISYNGFAQEKTGLKVVIIRHGEKPVNGDNLTCKGLNRAMALPAVLYSKIGVPDYVFVPSVKLAEQTKHARMIETAMPLAIKYNLTINSSYTNEEYGRIARDIKGRKGTVLVVWEHKAIAGIIKALGVKEELTWADDDFDSIWTITFSGKQAILTRDKEDIHPKDDCTF